MYKRIYAVQCTVNRVDSPHNLYPKSPIKIATVIMISPKNVHNQLHNLGMIKNNSEVCVE